MFTNTKRPVGNSERAFLGWQKIDRGTTRAPDSINRIGHLSNGSTVFENTLPELNLQVPQVPSIKRGSSSSVPH